MKMVLKVTVINWADYWMIRYLKLKSKKNEKKKSIWEVFTATI